MGVAQRAVLNVVRKPARTVAVVVIIGFCIAIFLTMTLVSNSISGRTNFLSADAATLITITPAGESGGGGFFFGGGNTMSPSVVSEVQGTPGAAFIQPVVQYTNGTFSPGSGGGPPTSFPTIVYGEDPGSPLVVGTEVNPTVVSGRALNSGDSSSMVAEVGSTYASDNSVTLGSTIQFNGTTLTVVGIYSTGQSFASSSVVVPLSTGQAIAGTSDLREIYVTANSAGDVDSVTSTLQNEVGDGYDVVPLSSIASEIQSSLNSIYDSSQTGLYLALITGAAVMVFVMVLATRERTKEIGVMKAIGFRNDTVVTQFLTESMVFAVVGFGIGVGLAELLSPTIGQLVLEQGGGAGPGGGGRFLFFGPSLSLSASPELIAATFVLAVGLGVLGALYPIVRAVRLRPAEALRYE